MQMSKTDGAKRMWLAVWTGRQSRIARCMLRLMLMLCAIPWLLPLMYTQMDLKTVLLMHAGCKCHVESYPYVPGLRAMEARSTV